MDSAALMQFGLLVAGFVVHGLMKAYEMDKKTPESEGFVQMLSAVFWTGDGERWRTLSCLILMALIAFGGAADVTLAGLGVTITETGGMLLVFIGAGYNIDSLMNKVFAIGK